MTQALYEKGLVHGLVSILAADPKMLMEDVSAPSHLGARASP